jgi:hypothetical protein
VGAFVLDTAWVYFIGERRLFRASKSGGDPEVVLDRANWVSLNLTANTTDIFVAGIDVQQQEWQLIRIARGGRDPIVVAHTPITSVAGSNESYGVTEMVATADTVYWLVSLSCTVELRRYRIGTP